MATKLYFRDMAANDPKPSGEVSTDTDNFTTVPTNKNTALRMLAEMGASGVTVTGAYSTAANSLAMVRLFTSRQLQEGQVITGAQTLNFAIALMESNQQMNLFGRFFVYVRSAAGSNSKTLYGPATYATREATTGGVGIVWSGTSSAGNYTTAIGDRIVVEFWFDIQNTRSTSYSASFYFNGATDPVDGTAQTTTAASYFQLNDNLAFFTPRSGCVNHQNPAIF
jgi:hypothetical protein